MNLHVLITLVFAVTTSAHHTPQPLDLNKGVILHLFEWKWLDIAKECEEFLAPNGFAGVQISPPNENIIITSPVMRPWWERYQPVSYKLNTRSGTEEELQEMLNRCNDKGVRIFADVVLNHMTGANGNKGTAGSEARYSTFQYPIYSKNDFHTSPVCDINNYNNAWQVRNCQLQGMRDLDQNKPYVQGKMLEFLNKLISMGVAGFRIDAAKHMWPSDLKVIFDRLDHLSITHGFRPLTKPLIYQEVIDYGTGEPIKWSEYRELGLVTDFRYSGELGDTFLGKKPLDWLKDYTTTPGKIPSDESIVFIDNHDTQRTGKSNELTNKVFRPYKMAIAFMLAYPWGTPKLMSGYYFQSHGDGPPHDDNYNILSPHPIENNVCKNKWSCEHRWRQIYNMVHFRNVVTGTEVTNFQSDDYKQAAFCRGNKGFIAFNTNSMLPMKKQFQTCLPKGKYCDVISGNLIDNKCTGKTIDVGEDGKALIEIPEFYIHHSDVERDNVLAIHVKAKVLDENDKNQKTEIEKWCDSNENQLTFCEEKKGFIAFSKKEFMANEKLKTCLPKGTYCDVVSGNLMNNICTGMTVEVSYDGTGTLIKGPVKDEDTEEKYYKLIAIHVGASLIKENDNDSKNNGNEDTNTIRRYDPLTKKRTNIIMKRGPIQATRRRLLKGKFKLLRPKYNPNLNLNTNPICNKLEELITKRDSSLTLSAFAIDDDDYTIFYTVSKIGKEDMVGDLLKIVK